MSVDKTPSEQPLANHRQLRSGFFRLDHAREAFVAQLGDMPLTSDQAAWVFHALAVYDYSELETLAALFARVRADGPL